MSTMEPSSTIDGVPEKAPSSNAAKRKAEWFEVDEEHNTSVYVSGLPSDKINEEKFYDIMKKFGIIAKSMAKGSPYSLKLYTNEDGSYKGDGRCRYVRKESAELAIKFLDDDTYEGSVIRCEPAKFTYKGAYDPSKKIRVDPKAKLKAKKVVDKLLSWDTKEPVATKQKTVILKNMFSPKEIINNAELLIDLKDDVEEICKTVASEPKRVDIYDKHPDGVIAIAFADHEHALAFIEAIRTQPALHYYATRQIEASLWDGRTKYKIRETDEESEERFEKWKQDIQNPGASEEVKADETTDAPCPEDQPRSTESDKPPDEGT